MRRLLRIRDLEYVVALAETASFVRAAAKLGISQPTLSTQIRRIEDLFGVSLFERRGRSIGLTPEGQQILTHARVVLHAFRELDRASMGAEGLYGRDIRFGVIPTVAPYFAPPLLRRMLALNEGGRIDLIEALTDNLEAAVEASELDFALTANLPKSPSLLAWPLGVEGLCYISRFPLDDDPLHGDTNRPILLMQEGHCFRDVVYAALGRLSRSSADALNYRIGPASLMTLTCLVRAGIGDSIVPAPFVKGFPALMQDLHTVDLDTGQFGRTVHMIVRKNRQGHVDLRALRDTLAAVHVVLSTDVPVVDFAAVAD